MEPLWIGVLLGGVVGIAAGMVLAQSRLQKTQSALHQTANALSAAEATSLGLRETQARLERDLSTAQVELKSAHERNVEMRELQATLLAEKTHLKEAQAAQQAFLTDARKQIEDAFANLASKALDATTQAALAQMKEQLSAQQQLAAQDLGARQATIEQMLRPVSDGIQRLGQETQLLEEKRAQEIGRVKEQLDRLGDAQFQLSSETRRLTEALKSAKARGRWGEIALQRILELAGLTAHVDFFTQQSQRTEEGELLRPDCIVALPGGRAVVIDAKVPFTGYYEATEAATETERTDALRRHADAVQKHVRSLTTKEYQKQIPAAADFVVMFVPNDTFLAAAVEHRPDLMDHALSSRVLIVTPAALLALLHTIALGWRHQAAEANAQEILELGLELCDRLGTFVGHLEKIGRQLEGAQDTYRKAIGSFEQRVLVSARRFEPLGVKSAKPLSLAIEGVSVLDAD